MTQKKSEKPTGIVKRRGLVKANSFEPQLRKKGPLALVKNFSLSKHYDTIWEEQEPFSPNTANTSFRTVIK